MPWTDEDDLARAGITCSEFDPQNAVQTFKDIVVALVTKPAAFFRGMLTEGGFLNPTLFLLACLVICGFLSTVLRASIWPLLRVPVLGTISIYMTSVILYLMSNRLFGGKGSYEATFRITAYSGAVFLIMWVSILDILAFLYGLYLLVLGTEQVHYIDRASSVASVVLSAVASLVLLLLFGFWRVGLIF
ncbi:MAG: YIP1 family protein [Candidatus Glassbacteria bacterium]